ncbi:SAM-dependent methyltransferase [Actinoplanes sp. NPDC049681]|uniref:SAM-dependent methyltransferase n=1 Tax=Actinoplanes sp. NPDC049681 TaxID=3363905 RepID=UPI0037B04953
MDLTQPVALRLVAVLHFLTGHDDPYVVVTRLLDRLAPGSYLVVSHATLELLPPEAAAALAGGDVPGRGDFTSRTYQQVARFRRPRPGAREHSTRAGASGGVCRHRPQALSGSDDS